MVHAFIVWTRQKDNEDENEKVTSPRKKAMETKKQ